MSQNLYEDVTAQWVNDQLDQGCQVVWITKTGDGYTVLLDTPEPYGPQDVVMEFLQGVNPQVLDQAIAKRARLSEGVGTAALKVLAEMVHPGQSA